MSNTNTDSIFAGVLDFYPSCSRSVLCQETIRDALIDEKVDEKAALSRCSLAINIKKVKKTNVGLALSNKKLTIESDAKTNMSHTPNQENKNSI